MGLVLCVEAVIAITEAVEVATAAAEGGEAIAGAVEAGEIIDAGATAGTEAGTEAGEGAISGVEEGGEALEQVLSKLAQAAKKIAKLVDDYIIIDAVFKTAKDILKAITYDPAAHDRAIKLTKLIKVLTQSSDLMKTLSDWLTENASKDVKLDDYVVSLQGVLSKFIPKLGAAAATLQKLADQVSQKNVKKDLITDGEVDAFEVGLQTVIKTLKSLADFKHDHSEKIPVLTGLPVDENTVAALQEQMP